MTITLRAASPDDAAFLFEVYASTRAEELALVPWSDEQRQEFLRTQFDAQHSYYHERFSDADYQVILVDEEAVGRLYVARDKKTVQILDIAVLPERRRAGVGTAVIQELLFEAGKSETAVQIFVETFNPSLGLFERLGFSRIAEEGFNLLLEWRASNSRLNA
jgi:ribosomal protein S18 acetylase RimI-like enzyme